MKRNTLVIAGAACAAGLLSACGGGHTTAAGPAPAPTTQALDTVGVYALAIHQSESASPTPVNDGALTLTDTSETSAPIAVNGN
jgi:hypothetical protein